mmetsp:Transcript_66265/g.188171  ORF Transcript_66265/g.188171 Transcript_66265/m.188171 type:complete len:336 (+) Transcript_66265:2272-3279(+)
MRSGDARHSPSSHKRLLFSGLSTLLPARAGNSSSMSGSACAPSLTVTAKVCQTARAASASEASPSPPSPASPSIAMRRAARACIAMACQSRSRSPMTARGQQPAARSDKSGSSAMLSSREGAANRHPSIGLSRVASSFSQPACCHRASCCTTSAASAGAARDRAKRRSPCAASTRRGVAASWTGSRHKAFRRARSHSARVRSAAWSSSRPALHPADPPVDTCISPSLLPSSSSEKAVPHASKRAPAAACRNLGSSNGSARSQKRSSAGKASSSRRTAHDRLPPPSGGAEAGAGSGGAHVPSQRSAQVNAKASCRQMQGLPVGPTCNVRSVPKASR